MTRYEEFVVVEGVVGREEVCVDVGMKEKESGVGEGSTLRVIADSKDATQSLQRGPVARLENTTREGLKKWMHNTRHVKLT